MIGAYSSGRVLLQNSIFIVYAEMIIVNCLLYEVKEGEGLILLFGVLAAV